MRRKLTGFASRAMVSPNEGENEVDGEETLEPVSERFFFSSSPPTLCSRKSLPASPLLASHRNQMTG
jgi:hypothetical protein